MDLGKLASADDQDLHCFQNKIYPDLAWSRFCTYQDSEIKI